MPYKHMEVAMGSSHRYRSPRPGTDRAADELPGSPVQFILLSNIDADDQMFHLRIFPESADIRKSIFLCGQQVPVVLWGKTRPYKIIDGFRRVWALKELHKPAVKAIIRDDLDEAGAFRLSYLENARRRNFSQLDRAHAIWIAVNKRGMTLQSAAKELGMTERQARRYLSLLSIPSKLQKAVSEGAISIGHAIVLASAHGIDTDTWIERIRIESLNPGLLSRVFKAL